ncbi:MAG: PQQ-binding-like beta-propeller repeat protein [Phenylobacterium sp.]|uniref:outer membrane protein assembly factor BamB family protein n=1 Tax=Phenylobacterium sp. TaxID=1871053 RepID=UPI001A60A318|nr:PQQ-binding-like beta-propeller repeat protein [Phenylobacterium sp.]MBL8773576.1 PQQ-binding-like beta-propeller repeat protein [Phenylobacterium sp.]
MRGLWGIAAGMLAAAGVWAAGSSLSAQTASQMPHPGQALYRLKCASCHDNPEATRSPAKAALEGMSVQTLEFAMSQGKMKAMAEGLSPEERGQLINYLTGRSQASVETWSQAMACPGRNVDLKGAPTVTTFGFDARQTRTLSARQTGLSRASLSRLDLAWAIGFPETTMIRAQPAVVGDMVFLPVAESSAMYAFDVSDPAKPCVKWVYRAPGAPLRTSAAYGVLADGVPVLAFAGLDTTVHVVDARTGKALWTKHVGSYAYSMTTGTPRVLKDRIIVPVSQFEIMVAANNSVACCTNHGYVLSLDPKTGAQQWRYDTMPDAQPVRDRGDGKPLLGPSGAPIWNSPVVDEKRGLIFFGTGESNSPPAHRNTDALIAIRLKDGTEAWSHQATADDIFNVGCGLSPPAGRLNCVKAPETVYRDVDFGASFMSVKLRSGRELVLAGQKSGTVWALDPDTGKVVWRTDIGTGAPNGGIHWGIAFLDDTVIVPVAAVGRQLPGGPPIDAKLTPGLYGVDANTGAIRWQYSVGPDCAGERGKKAPRCERLYGFSGAPTVIDGVAIQGSLDGRLFAIDTRTGKALWSYDTLRDFPTLNGVPGKGGSIDAASIVGVNGLVLVGSGYGMFGQAPGNVLLAFRPR